MQKLLDICLNIKPTAYEEQEVGGSKVVTSGDVASVGSGGMEEKIVTSEVPTTGEIALSTPDFLLKLPGIDLGSPSEAYLSEDS